MKVEIVNVTPQLASEWLRANRGNRTIRRNVVDGLRLSFQRGEYKRTHQGVAFSESGRLLDGQHRLTAISEMRDGVFPMVVATGLPDDAFLVMDIGAKRNAADALQESDRKLVEVARLIGFTLMNGRSTVTPQMLLPIIDEIRHQHESLIAFCPRCSRTWSSAPMRLAAVISMNRGGDKDYIKSVYRALVLSRFGDMPPVAHALYKSVQNGSARASNTLDMLARGLIVFDERKASTSRIQSFSTSEASESVRKLFGHLVNNEDVEGKKKAARESAAKDVLPLNYISTVRKSAGRA